MHAQDNTNPLAPTKYPKDLDFTKTIGGTTYVVKSRFDKSAGECLTGIVMRWIDKNTDISGNSL
jgi:hypothetical protein